MSAKYLSVQLQHRLARNLVHHRRHCATHLFKTSVCRSSFALQFVVARRQTVLIIAKMLVGGAVALLAPLSSTAVAAATTSSSSIDGATLATAAAPLRRLSTCSARRSLAIAVTWRLVRFTFAAKTDGWMFELHRQTKRQTARTCKYN